jgi:Family of unknown function (DUF6459)
VTTSLAARPRPAPGQRAVIGGIPLIRVRPAPSFEPPYDDEPGPREATAADPQLAKRPGRDERRGHGHRRGPEERSGEERLSGPAPAGPAGGSPPRAGTGGQAAYRYVGLCLEVLEGFRPAAHLRRLTSPAAFDAVLEQLARPAARTGHQSSAGPMPGGRTTAASAPAGSTGRAAPTGGGRRAGGPGAERLRLRRLWVGEPSNGVVEAAAVVGRADRAWALALRLERREETWLCTDLQVI